MVTKEPLGTDVKTDSPETAHAVPMYYINACEIEMAPFDCLLRLGIKQERSKPGMGPNDVLCDVIMSPQHAKSLVVLLGLALDEYEKQLGKIGLPELPTVNKSK